MADQHKYTVDVTVTENTARVQSLTLRPSSSEPFVEVVFAIGEENAGTFTQTDTKVLRKLYSELPAPLLAVLDDLEDKALAAGETDGFFPAGANEAIPPTP